MRLTWLVLPLLIACSTTKTGPSPVEVSATGVTGEAAANRYRKFEAVVNAIDHAKRTMVVTDRDYKQLTVVVPPKVMGFDAVAVGDSIRLEVAEGLLLQYQPAGMEPVPTTPIDVAPGGTAGIRGASTGYKSTVRVTAIDLKTRVVRLQDADGNHHEVTAGENVALEKLKVGDRLTATYVAASAVTLSK